MQNVALIGNPNVGKSVLFYHLTGNYVTVSNYPGTTVEVSQGKANLWGRTYTIYDTPGMYSLFPITEEEAVARRLLMEVSPHLVVHVIDAKNLPRMLPLTLELINAGFQVILVLNMMDEAEKLGVCINKSVLARRLGIPVLEAAFTRGQGISPLKKEIAKYTAAAFRNRHIAYREHPLVLKAGRCLQGSYPVSAQTVARLCLEGDQEILGLVREQESDSVVNGCLAACMAEISSQNEYDLTLKRFQEADTILAGIFHTLRRSEKISRLEALTLNPLGGFFMMLFVLYAGLYLFVGRFGAGFLVDLLEGTLLGDIVIPAVSHWLQTFIIWDTVLELLTGEFGLLTMGFRYAFGIILPIVGTYFFMFALLEDSGYLPRLSFWANGLMRRVGLNGRAVIPLTLGLGCGTMAVLVTRTLESVRERIIATFLLALAVPCSAQLGLILALLAKEPVSLMIWAGVVGAMFIISGIFLNAILPGREAPFFMELPPLRLPTLNAIFQKTLARMRWYFIEIIPVFIVISILLWLLQQTGILEAISAFLTPFLGQMGLPHQMSKIFLFGFFRRDYGAAGLWDLYQGHLISGGQLLVSAIVLTLFLPCLAQFAMMIRERGIIVSFLIMGVISVVAYAVGLLLRIVLVLPVY